MKTKIVYLIFVLALGIGFLGFSNVKAQTPPVFPDGCGSALGYSSTTGEPCNGTSDATEKFMLGCSSALGYSATTGTPCSGGSVAIQMLAGCTSTLGYSAVSGEPCNGTLVATINVMPPVTPGLPSTGNNPNNLIILAISAATILGLSYIIIAKSRRITS